MSRKALGRGLKALIPDSPAERPTLVEDSATRLSISELKPNPFQPRREWSDAELQNLAESLKIHGLLEPILARPASGQYEIIAGERRVRAAQLLGWTHIEARIRSVSDEEALQLALVENLQRKDLNPMEEARGYRALAEQFSWTHDRVANEVGKSRTAISNSLRLLKLPESVKEYVSRETLSEGHARTLLGLPNPAMQERLAGDCVSKGLSVRQLEKMVRQLAKRLESRGRKGRSTPGREEIQALQHAMTQAMSMDISISGNRNRGAVRIRYGSREELEGLIARLGIVIH
ncbi:MAG: ParB/RepB/Spo0J family partition protein [Candidatus Eisenbacteria bacterium]|uniref:ParB/RepB/Spo0J family partition protein n=1 Tax=Eiseniibacteriota bacterium TaxID=2212470 RepID=A0A948S116_UNCEI|nr:ParB/RepB/Spo0J family partition protein [Candidatus Eisenbacteria bacterium]MBU1947250.1 ParB/RepB/Spo0J family partition protein [Candidatus Eisenbacteria bacterium]MBU2693332.1 ParB/RepB/Spo0J family partition protein [Candidatus Eisenbacteria bacterium]